MSSRLAPLFASLALLLALPGHAALSVGAPAPDFSTDAAVGGQSFKFKLAEALKQGPVVLYFYPKAFTSGCTVEAHQFAEATDKFKTHGVTVIGMSNDDIDTLKKFSVDGAQCMQLALALLGLGQHCAQHLDRRQLARPVGGQQRRRAEAGDHFFSFSAAFSIASMWPSGFMLACTAATLPSGAIR